MSSDDCAVPRYWPTSMETVPNCRAYTDRPVPILRVSSPLSDDSSEADQSVVRSRCRLFTVKGLVVSRGPIPTYSFSDDQSRTYSFSDNVSLILGEAAPQPVLHTVSRIVSTQIIDAALNMAPNNQKTEVVPPAEVREDVPLPSDPKVIFLGSIRTCGAGGRPTS